MLFKMGETFIHTVTVLRFVDGSMAIDRATHEEAKQVAKWFEEGVLSFDVANKMFVINSTGSTKMLGTNINVTYITWHRTNLVPFFGTRDVGEDTGFTPMCSPLTAVYSLLDGKLAYEGPRVCDHRYEDWMLNNFATRPNPDAIPSIPEELDVEKDEQPKIVEKNWPSFMPNGVYNRELHIANCNELAQMYPTSVRAVSPFEDKGHVDEDGLAVRRKDTVEAFRALIREHCSSNWLDNLFGGWTFYPWAKKEPEPDPISKQMLKAHEPEHLVEIIDPRDELVQPSFKQFAILDSMVSRYVTLIKTQRDSLSFELDRFGNKTSLAHLLTMLGTVNDREVKMTIGKRQRWLGYVQGMLVAHQLIGVDTERDATREILNGQ
jgi:hypothetical protein